MGRIALQGLAVDRPRRLVLAGLVAQDAESIVGPRVLRIAVRRAAALHGGQGGLAERHVELAEAVLPLVLARMALEQRSVGLVRGIAVVYRLQHLRPLHQRARGCRIDLVCASLGHESVTTLALLSPKSARLGQECYIR